MVPQLSAILHERQAECPYVCYRLDRLGHAVRIKGLRKVWESCCVKVGLGEFVEQTDAAAGERVCGKPLSDRKNAKPKVKVTYVGRIYHDLRRSAVRAMVNAGVDAKTAMTVSGHRTRSVFDHYRIVTEADLDAVARKIAEKYERETGHDSGTIDVVEARTSFQSFDFR